MTGAQSVGLPPQHGQQAHGQQGGQLVALAQVGVGFTQCGDMQHTLPCGRKTEVLNQPHRAAHQGGHSPSPCDVQGLEPMGLQQQQRHAGPTDQQRDGVRLGGWRPRRYPWENHQQGPPRARQCAGGSAGGGVGHRVTGVQTHRRRTMKNALVSAGRGVRVKGLSWICMKPVSI